MICVGQLVHINYTDIDGKDFSSYEYKVDYWNPTQKLCDNPIGTIDPLNITNPTISVLNIVVAKGILNMAGIWKFRITDTTTGVCWNTSLANSIEIKVGC